MSKPAARLGDPTAHGGSIVFGWATVVIGGQPAARLADPHVCPMVNPGPVPHVGGPISGPCCPTVLIGCMPAAVVGDLAVCVGPPDTIAMGCPTVLIGMPGAAPGAFNPSLGGLLGALAGGVAGALIGGLLGGPIGALVGGVAGAIIGGILGMRSVLGHSIRIEGSPEFQRMTRAHLQTLAATPSGRALIESLDASGRTITISECAPGADGANTASAQGWADPNLYNGTGTDATVGFNPNRTPMYDGSQPWMNPPPAAILGHELTHASHISNGNLAGDPTSGPGVPNDFTSGLPMNRALEERRTVGAPADPAFGQPDYSGEPFSENTFRRDLGEPARPTYLYDAAGNPVW